MKDLPLGRNFDDDDDDDDDINRENIKIFYILDIPYDKYGRIATKFDSDYNF